MALVLGVPGFASAQARPEAGRPMCPARPFRWNDDCRNLAGADLMGLERLRYAPLSDDGRVWLSLGGEARTRVEALEKIDFGIGDQPGYLAIAGRLQAHADLHAGGGLRLFAQVGVVQQDGRKPGPRPQDESDIDVTQAFADLPFEAAGYRANIRVGRQELDLSANRLISTRDGANLRRAFEGVKVDIERGGGRLSLVSVRPMDLHAGAFDDRADTTERFNAISLDLPQRAVGGAALNLFYFDRDRTDARFLRARGADRRHSLGAHYVNTVAGWRIDAQGALQVGRNDGKPVRAYGFGVAADRDLGGQHNAVLGLDLVGASGDKAGTRTIETFDPIYPNNGGLSDAPLFYQTNYVFAGGGVSARWGGATWAGQTYLMVRHSAGDAIYANGRPIPVAFGDSRRTAIMSQVSVRRSWGSRYEAYASIVRAGAMHGVRQVGGDDAYYSRLQLTARF